MREAEHGLSSAAAIVHSGRMQRGSCKFRLVSPSPGKHEIIVELFHNTVPLLHGSVLSFELLGGTIAGDAQRIIDALNEKVLGLQITTAIEAKADKAW